MLGHFNACAISVIPGPIFSPPPEKKKRPGNEAMHIRWEDPLL